MHITCMIVHGTDNLIKLMYTFQCEMVNKEVVSASGCCNEVYMKCECAGVYERSASNHKAKVMSVHENYRKCL